MKKTEKINENIKECWELIKKSYKKTKKPIDIKKDDNNKNC